MIRFLSALILVIALKTTNAQATWMRVDTMFGSIPPGAHVYKTTTMLEGKPNISFYVEIPLQDKRFSFQVDTGNGRRLRPEEFYNLPAVNEGPRRPFVIVNTTFFSFATNQNLNVVIRNGTLVGYNIHSLAGRGKDTFTYRHPVPPAIGITAKRKADIAWVFTDSSKKHAYASQQVVPLVKDSIAFFKKSRHFRKWKMRTAVGGGPVLVQDGKIMITNNEEWRFAGKAVDDRHPRTAIGYTANSLIIMVVEGRNPGIAEGASLKHLAVLLKDIGCIEAMNLDGGGSSCMLINGKETIRPSDNGKQRPVPAVFVVSSE